VEKDEGMGLKQRVQREGIMVEDEESK